MCAKAGQPEKKERNQAITDLIKFSALSYAEIGNLFDISKQAVGKIAKRWGVARSGSHHQTPLSQNLGCLTTSPVS